MIAIPFLASLTIPSWITSSITCLLSFFSRFAAHAKIRHEPKRKHLAWQD
jgi:hypothetical protein